MHQPNCYENYPKTHHDNHWLDFHYDNVFEGFPVQQHPLGPQIKQYLKRTLRILQQTTLMQPRTFVRRLDLRFPAEYPANNLDHKNVLLEAFWRYLRRELGAASLRHPPRLQYLWAREQDTSPMHHYHLMLLLNYDAICTVGDIYPSPGGGYYRNNLYHRVVRSWARSFGWPSEKMNGLVHVCFDDDEDPQKNCLHRTDHATFADVFYAASYLCKSHSKVIGQRGHPFGSSQLLARSKNHDQED